MQADVESIPVCFPGSPGKGTTWKGSSRAVAAACKGHRGCFVVACMNTVMLS